MVCGAKFQPRRLDAKYCKPACRQRSHRARAGVSELDREIEETRVHYWKLIAQKAHALGRARLQIVTDESQYVDADGNVFVGGVLGGGGWRLAGRTAQPHRQGWSAWGLEAAGPPWAPPSNLEHRPDKNGGHYESAILGRQRKADGRRRAGDGLPALHTARSRALVVEPTRT